MAKKPATNDGAIKARIIAVCDLGAIDDVIEIDPAQTKALAGIVDTDPDAVAYAEKLKG